MKIKELTSYLDKLLQVRDFKDASYNGLQVAGPTEVKKIATACTASLEAIEAAAKAGADTLIVHHGLFWHGADPCLVGNYYARVKALMEHNINLLAYHLPMDAHLEWGNNAYLAHILGCDSLDYVVPGDRASIGMRAHLMNPLSVQEIVSILCHRLDTKVTLLGHLSEDMMLEDLAICSGSGSFLLDNNKNPDFQALITGDVNEQTYHMAEETGTLVFVLGHHASEQEAINILGGHLASNFNVEHVATHFTYEKSALTFAYDGNTDHHDSQRDLSEEEFEQAEAAANAEAAAHLDYEIKQDVDHLSGKVEESLVL